MALVFKNGTFRLSNISSAPSADYTEVVQSVVWTPTSSPVTWTGISGATISDSSLATWTLDITFRQHDLADDESLPNVMFDNEGETATAEYTPYAGGPTYTGHVTLQAPTVGSDGTAVAVATVSLPSDKPVRA
jgi:hypothetical protein